VLKVPAAATFSKRPQSAIRQAIRDGELEVVSRKARPELILRASLERWTAQNQAPFQPPEGFLTLDEIAGRFKLTLAWVKTLVRRGELEAIAFGRAHRAVSEESLQRWLKQRQDREAHSGPGQLPVTTALKEYGLSNTVVRRAIRLGHLPSELVAGPFRKIRILRRAEVESWIESRQLPKTEP
jgi:excisionase family DNA binding protein